jgi:hypothetical protein
LSVKNHLALAAAIALMAPALMAPGAAVAQAPPAPQPPIAPKTEQLDPKACAPSDTQSTVGQSGDLQMQQKSGRDLSDKLARSDGVICPPNRVDSEIHAPTPPGGAMPVIPPPGSPGGDPSVKPK